MTNPVEIGEYPAVPAIKVGVSGCCPRCGEGRLYDGLLQPAKGCKACRLDYVFIDAGDGPTVFVIMFLGFVVLGLALFVDSAWSPPVWVHIILWLPLIAILGIFAMRVVKGMLIAQQYVHNAHQGELDG